jgi:hypothetical protein
MSVKLTMAGLGAYAEYIVVSTKMLVHKPKQLSWEEAAGIPEVRSFLQTFFLQSTIYTPEITIRYDTWC